MTPVGLRPLRSLRVRLTASFLAVAVLPVALLGVVALSLALTRARTEVVTRSGDAALGAAAEIGRYLEAQLASLREVALAVDELAPAARWRLESHVIRHLAANPALRSLVVLGPDGRVTMVSPPDPDVAGSDLSAEPFVAEARARGEPTWSSATVGLRDGRPLVAVALPAREGLVVGYLDFGITGSIVSGARAGPGAKLTIVDGHGTVIADRSRVYVREQVNVGDQPPVRSALAGEPSSAEVMLFGERRIASAAPIPHARWVVLATEPIDEAFASYRRLQGALVLALVLAASLAAVTGLRSARQVLRPIDALAQGTRRMAGGDYAAPARRGALRYAELEELSASFATMREAVRTREAALARSERNYRSLASTPVVGVARLDLDGAVLYANDAFARLAGAAAGEVLLGRAAASLFRDAEACARLLAEVRTASTVVNVEATLGLEAPGRPCLLNLSRDAETVTLVAVDISDLKRAAEEHARLEAELFRAQRLEALGRLAGGVAHDFNNLLTVILAEGAALRDAVNDPQAAEGADAILAAAERAAQLTRSLLAYGRKQVLARRPVELGQAIRGVEPLLRRIIAEDVRLVFQASDRPVPVLADRGQLEQVVMNLCTNARDAMPGGGTITLAVDRVELGAAEARRAGLAGGGSYARLAISDSGRGMNEAERSHLFEPFFSTKAAGKGSGLGLAIVDGIVRQHQGGIEVRSTPGEGTTISVMLPILQEGAPLRAAGADAAPSTARARSGEVILLAEDEPLVRKVLARTLADAGYRVLEASDGAEAVKLFEAERDAVALCVFDVIMPVMNGRDALEAVSRLRPGTRALLVSGYTDDILEKRGLPEDVDLLQKPIEPDELLARVRAALDRPAREKVRTLA